MAGLVQGAEDATDLRAIFDLFDTDRDEKLSAADAGHAWKLLGFDVAPQDLMGYVTIDADDWFAMTQSLSAKHFDSKMGGRHHAEGLEVLAEMKSKQLFNALRATDPLRPTQPRRSAEAAPEEAEMSTAALFAAAKEEQERAGASGAPVRATPAPAPDVVSAGAVLRAFRAVAGVKKRAADAERAKRAAQQVHRRGASPVEVKSFEERAARRYAEVTERECASLLDFMSCVDEDGVPDGMLSQRSLVEFMKQSADEKKKSIKKTPRSTPRSSPTE